jgi:hypothetical protein
VKWYEIMDIRYRYQHIGPQTAVTLGLEKRGAFWESLLLAAGHCCFGQQQKEHTYIIMTSPSTI